MPCAAVPLMGVGYSSRWVDLKDPRRSGVRSGHRSLRRRMAAARDPARDRCCAASAQRPPRPLADPYWPPAPVVGAVPPPAAGAACGSTGCSTGATAPAKRRLSRLIGVDWARNRSSRTCASADGLQVDTASRRHRPAYQPAGPWWMYAIATMRGYSLNDHAVPVPVQDPTQPLELGRPHVPPEGTFHTSTSTRTGYATALRRPSRAFTDHRGF